MIKNYSNIITLEKYIEARESSFGVPKNIKQKVDLNIEIKKLFILIFYYERLLSKYFESSFTNINEKYYLINPEYLFKLKQSFNYQENYEYKLNDLNLNINYIELDENTEKFFQNTYFENESTMEKNNFEYLKNINNIKSPICQKGQFKYFSNAFILPSKIYYLIKNLFFQNQEENIMPTKIIYKEEDLLIYFNYNIEIGNLNEHLLFTPKYFFDFNKTRFEIELKTILYNSIEEYLNSRKCSEKQMEPQNLLNRNNNLIGVFISLINKGKTQNIQLKDSQQLYKKIKTLDNSNYRSKTQGKVLKTKAKNNKQNINIIK